MPLPLLNSEALHVPQVKKLVSITVIITNITTTTTTYIIRLLMHTGKNTFTKIYVYIGSYMRTCIYT